MSVQTMTATHNAFASIAWKHESEASVYEKARIGRVFNHRRPEKYPQAVVEAETIEDVQQAVKLANELGLRVAIRSGGHSWAAWSVREDTVLIDLGEMKHISLDSEEKVVVVSPSTTGRALNDYLSPHGLMFAGGHCPSVGLGGFLLQGGMGWNCKNWGWACDQIQALDVVTPKGELIRVDDVNHADLMWAARGCGPGFPGVVVRFHLKLREAYDYTHSSMFIYPLSKYTEAMRWIVDISPTFDPNTEIVALSATIPAIGSRCLVLHFLCFKNSAAEAEAALKPANTSRPAGFLVEAPNQRTSIANEYIAQAYANPEGHRYCAENAYIKNDVDVVSVMEEAFKTPPTPNTYILWFAMNPCSRRPAPVSRSLSMQTDHYLAVYGVWKDAKDDTLCQSWVRDTMQKIVPYTEGAYLGDSDFQVRQTKFWTDESASKLMQLRRQYDPEGVICGYLDRGDKSGTRGLANKEILCTV